MATAPVYTPPEWGRDGANAFGIYMEVVKGGVIVENLALPMTSAKSGASCVVAGRMDPVCDLVLQHPSVSRMHAVLQFDAQGALFLRDLNSTHGTFVNKRRVVVNEYVRLHIGDVIGFGESTRLYAVCGPPELLPAEYDSLNLQKFREKSSTRQETKAKQREKLQKENEGASWGFGEDAEEENDGDASSSGDEDESNGGKGSKEKLPDYLRNLKENETPFKSRVQQSEINEKDQKLFQQLQTRIRKMENLKLEKSRIQAKQNQLTGLSEGQEKTLERNEQRIQALRKEIEDIEDRIYAKNAQREQTKASAAASAAVAASVASRKKKQVNEALYGYGSDEDDFYDRTKSNQRKHLERKQQFGVADNGSTSLATSSKPASAQQSSGSISSSVVLTADSIQAKIKALEIELRDVGEAYAATQAHPAAAEEPKQEEEVDSLDAFMETTTRELHTTQLSSISARKQELERELQHLRQLLKVATPALAAFPTHTRAPSNERQKDPITNKSAALPHEETAPQPEKPDTTQTPKETRDDVSSSSTVVVSPLKRPVVAEPTTSKPHEQEDRVDPVVYVAKPRGDKPEVKDNVAKPKRQRVLGPTLGPARGSPTLGGSSGTGKPASSTRIAAGAVSSNATFEGGSTLEGGEQVWVPPANQTGDGRTRLNDKYGY
uniref:FHA domain-containing protein n=1 Tax=Globisporangium ultimum (strain ATCC 200006 / CBS 805.95 / DAOM BR144) TaxID=431595 RepID=K3WIY9_GLOUD